MRKWKDLGARGAGRLWLNGCSGGPIDQEGAVPCVSGAGQDGGSFPAHPSALLGLHQPSLRVLGERTSVYHLHLHGDWPSLFLFRGSKILCTGPGGRSLRTSPTTTDSECSVHRQRASPHLLPSPRALTLLAIPIFPRASSCCWLFSAMCLRLPLHAFIPKSQ